MAYDSSAFAALVGKVLEELEDDTWALDEARRGRFYLHLPALDGSRLALSLVKGRVVVRGLTNAAPDAWGVEWPQITVAAERRPEVIAREIERWLLPCYRATLAEALEVQRQYDEHRGCVTFGSRLHELVFAVQRQYDEHRGCVQAQAQQLAALLGEPFEPGGSSGQPRLCRYQSLPDGDLATLQLRVGRSTHRLELSLPHDQAVAVVELLTGLWTAG